MKKSDRVRTTISITPEALEIFKRMGAAANTSTSKIMGDWLDDTIDAAQMITLKMEEAKKAPLMVLREMQSMIAGLSDVALESTKAIRSMKSGQRTEQAKRPGVVQSIPPSSNTGGKVPKTAKNRGNSL